MINETCPAYFLPFLDKSDTTDKKFLTFSNKEKRINLEYPVITSDIINRIFYKIKQARKETLETMSVCEILDICDKVSALWMNREYPLRKYAVEWLPCITGFSHEMVNLCIDNMMAGLNRKSLEVMLCEELGQIEFLDEFVFKKNINIWSKAYGPEVITEIFSGNVPGLPVLDILCGLLLKSGIVAKTSSKEPLFANLLVRTIVEVSPGLKDCIAIGYWEGGDETIETSILNNSKAIIAYGGIHSMNQLSRKISDEVNFIRYGHKISFGIIGKEKLSPENINEVVQSAAYDVAIFDQLGCLSPHVFFVEMGSDNSPKDFAEKLAGAMEQINQQLPPSTLDTSAIIEINNTRTLYELREIKGEDVKVYYSRQKVHWTVIYEDSKEFIPSCLYRVIRILPFEKIDNIIEKIKPIKRFLQTVGISMEQSRKMEVCNKIGKLGATRFTPIGKMTEVPIFWHHDGRYNILDLIRWVDIQK